MLLKKIPGSDIIKRKGTRQCELQKSKKYFANMRERRNDFQAHSESGFITIDMQRIPNFYVSD